MQTYMTNEEIYDIMALYIAEYLDNAVCNYDYEYKYR